MFFYNDKINNYFLNPKYYGSLDSSYTSVLTIKEGSSKLGRYIIFQIKLDDTRSYIKNAVYKAYACGATIASLEWLAEKIINQKTDILDTIKIEDVVNDLELPKKKFHCALTIKDLAKKLKEKL